MKFKKSIPITLFLCLLMIGSVSATNDNITTSNVNDDVITHTEDNGYGVGKDINDRDGLKKNRGI